MNQKNQDLMSNELKNQTFSNALGSPLLALLQGLFAWGGYAIFGLSDAFFWGMMTGFFSLMPLVGSALIWAPAGLYQMTAGTAWQGVGILLYGLIVIGTVDNVFRFIFQKQFANVHPLITVFGVIMGIKMFGVPGLIFGPLILSWFIILIRIYREDLFIAPQESEPAPIEKTNIQDSRDIRQN
jgi:predicted PurR-regulated permease PerM